MPGTVLTRSGLPGPLPMWQPLAIFGYALVVCRRMNDGLKVATHQGLTAPSAIRIPQETGK